jgi:hypothetical protein
MRSRPDWHCPDRSTRSGGPRSREDRAGRTRAALRVFVTDSRPDRTAKSRTMRRKRHSRMSRPHLLDVGSALAPTAQSSSPPRRAFSGATNTRPAREMRPSLGRQRSRTHFGLPGSPRKTRRHRKYRYTSAHSAALRFACSRSDWRPEGKHPATTKVRPRFRYASFPRSYSGLHARGACALLTLADCLRLSDCCDCPSHRDRHANTTFFISTPTA